MITESSKRLFAERYGLGAPIYGVCALAAVALLVFRVRLRR